jgi:hypothetical protein
MRWRRRRTDPRVGTNTACPRDTARLAGSSRRERVYGIGGSSAMSGLRLGQSAAYRPVPPAHGGTSGLSTMKHGRSLRHLGVRRWQPRGQPRECQLRSLRRTQSAWSRRHGPHREVRVSARIERWGGRQRQEGNGRSDAVRLLASGMLRRVRTALRETTVTTRRDTRCSNRLERGPSGPRSRRPESEVGKRSEPYPYRDARCPEPRAEQTVEVVGIHEGGT